MERTKLLCGYSECTRVLRLVAKDQKGCDTLLFLFDYRTFKQRVRATRYMRNNVF